ncbi:MAG TPA: MarP family serine protease [Candidatus Saccharimonadales bacterium]|nr:MarP family serine protease [Candidatus Saccharimonadales bacterium]
MDWLDLIIVVLLLGGIGRGIQLGLVRQAGSTIGFFGGLFLGAYIGEKLLVRVAQTASSRAFFSVLLTLGCAMICSSIGEYLGAVLKYRMRAKFIDKFDQIFGGAVGAATLLGGIWLAAALFANMPLNELQSQLHNSTIIAKLDRSFPPAPDVLSRIGRLVVPDNFPQVFAGLEPHINTSPSLPSLGDISTVAQRDENSVVKVAGRGCGGIVEGSGFVAGPDLVITNAHVVAGIANPYVLSNNRTLPADVVWFDPNVDFALLRVDGLSEAPLTIDNQTVYNGTPGAVLGYPGGGPFTAVPAAVLQEFTAVGHNIYNQGQTTRDVYSIKASVVPGNSGGPLISKSGQVIGLVFAQSTTYNQVGYALTAKQFVSEFHQASSNTQPVSTGSCAE